MRAVSHSVPTARRPTEFRPHDKHTRRGCATVSLAFTASSHMSIAAPRYEQVTQRHGHATALRGVELEVEHGAMVALNGAGKDRKSTRLNSSHTVISYAVFC